MIKEKLIFEGKYSKVWEVEKQLEEEIETTKPIKKFILKDNRFKIRKNWWKKVEFKYAIIL